MKRWALGRWVGGVIGYWVVLRRMCLCGVGVGMRIYAYISKYI